MAPLSHVRPRIVLLLAQSGPNSATSSAHKLCLPVLLPSEQIDRQTCISQRRHASSKRHVSTAVAVPDSGTVPEAQSTMPSTPRLSCLPWSTLVRSYAVTSISSIPLLLRPSIAVMSFLAKSKRKWLNPDHNRVLHALLKKTFYEQFCAGETPLETKSTIDDLKRMGFAGVILGHAREVVLSKEEMQQLDTMLDCPEQEKCNAREIKRWKEDTLATIQLASQGDFVALKFTGSGRQALQHLKATIPCAPALRDSIHEMCTLAQQRGVSLLFDAEQASLQDGIDNWTMYYMRHYNKERAVVYGTYQAYAKRTPKVLAQHLGTAQQENFVLGVKLVRGAYINSDPRELFWETIEQTHKCYDNLARCVMERKYGGLLQPVKDGSKDFPHVEFILASHNAESVKKAQALRDEQAQTGRPRIRMSYGQLMGMADHVSCDLVQQANARRTSEGTSSEIPQAFKYLVWGTMGECMKYLLRRAQENKDAVSRTVDARKALGKEIALRLGLARA